MHTDMENAKYKVSVRLMTYQHEAYIRQAMEGVLFQRTTFPVEVVVGDDFSTDRTLDIIREFTPTQMIHIRILERKQGDDYAVKRKALGRLYNFSDIVMHCQGEYVALLDGDDYWTDPLKLQKQADFLDTHADYAACYHPVTVVNADGSEIKSSKSSFVHNRDFSAEELIKGRVMSTLSLCFRNVIREFPEEFFKSPTGDNFLCSLLGHHGRGKFLGSIQPSAYRMHQTGTWSLKGEDSKRMTLIKSYFWLWQYYERVGRADIVQMFYRKILMEGFYSDPLKGVVPAYLGVPEQFLIRTIRRLFRVIRYIFGAQKRIQRP